MNIKFTLKVFLFLLVVVLCVSFLVKIVIERYQSVSAKNVIVENVEIEVKEKKLPRIESIVPSEAIVGKRIVVTGENLAGFEGDVSYVLEKINGDKIRIMASSTNTGTENFFFLKNPCQKGEIVHGQYSGIPEECDYVELTPGNYKIYTDPWGVKSNEIQFEILKPTISDTSKIDEIESYENMPVGYSDPRYSNIVGYDKDVGIIMNIPSGVVPSVIKDKSLQEVVAYRLEDKLSGKYNDVFVIFSCFEAGIPRIVEEIPYVDFTQQHEVKHLLINGIDYYFKQYDDFFMLSDKKWVGSFNSSWDITGCGLYMVGKDFSEVHMSFLKELKYIESRDKFFENIYNKFNELYVSEIQ